MKRILLFLKRNILLFILICFTVIVVIMYALSGSGDSHCRFVYDFQVCNFGPKNRDVISRETQSPAEIPTEGSNERIKTFMPLTGTEWMYEGKRTFYDTDSKTIKEVLAKKVIEITGVANEGENVRATYKEIYTNDPDFTVKEGSYLFSEDAFAFDGKKVVTFPLVLGQRLSFDSPERDDGLYDYYVSAVLDKEVFDKQTTCYEIVYKTLADMESKIFCEGIGYIRDYYQHNGTPNESDYRLVSIGVTD